MEVRRGERDEPLMSQADLTAYAYPTCGYSRRRREEPLTGQTARWPLTASAGIPPSRKPSKYFEGQPSIITITRTHALAPQKTLVIQSAHSTRLRLGAPHSSWVLQHQHSAMAGCCSAQHPAAPSQGWVLQRTAPASTQPGLGAAAHSTHSTPRALGAAHRAPEPLCRVGTIAV